MLTMQAGTSGAVAVVDVTGVIGWDDAQCLEFADKLKTVRMKKKKTPETKTTNPHPPRKPATMTKKTTKALQGKKGKTKTRKPPRRQA